MEMSVELPSPFGTAWFVSSSSIVAVTGSVPPGTEVSMFVSQIRAPVSCPDARPGVVEQDRALAAPLHLACEMTV